MSCLTALGPSHGSIGEWQNLHAIPILCVLFAPLPAQCWWRSLHFISQLEQPCFAHLEPRRDHRHRAEPCTLLWRPQPQPLGLRRSRYVCGFVPVHPVTQHSIIFQHVDVLIYMFEVSTYDVTKDTAYYHDSSDAPAQLRRSASAHLTQPLHQLPVQAASPPMICVPLASAPRAIACKHSHHLRACCGPCRPIAAVRQAA